MREETKDFIGWIVGLFVLSCAVWAVILADCLNHKRPEVQRDNAVYWRAMDRQAQQWDNLQQGVE